jgi:hypothetical protein
MDSNRPLSYPKPVPASASVAVGAPTAIDDILVPDTVPEPSEQPEGAVNKGWQWPWTHKSVEEKVQQNYVNKFSGKVTLRRFHRHYHPARDPESWEEYLPNVSKQDTADGKAEAIGGRSGTVLKRDGKYLYVNKFHQLYHKFDDVAVYLSPTRVVPRRLVVQATNDVLKNHLHTGDWIRAKVSGNVPFVLDVAEWALRPWNRRGVLPKVDTFFRILLTALPIQIILALPWISSWDEEDVNDSYTDYPGFHWNWPKYAVNPLDMRPPEDSTSQDGLPDRVDYKRRTQRPLKLVIKKGGKWAVHDNKDEEYFPAYVFISWEWDQFGGADGLPRVQRMAEEIAESEGCSAYWLDKLCIIQDDSSETDHDIYTMCDIVRGARRVAIVLVNGTKESRQSWGRRMWTLPEGLLAPGESVLVCHRDSQGLLQRDIQHKVEMTGRLVSPPPMLSVDSPI